MFVDMVIIAAGCLLAGFLLGLLTPACRRPSGVHRKELRSADPFQDLYTYQPASPLQGSTRLESPTSSMWGGGGS